ncbi:MAG: hypothetical protein HY916_07900 [Desulfovibrio sp.]|jgi:hypothetical protein|nr:hypothetical protein [Desulfovibrio sp.]
MSSLRPLIGALALTALLAARTVPEAAEAYVFSAAASVIGAPDAAHCSDSGPGTEARP